MKPELPTLPDGWELINRVVLGKYQAVLCKAERELKPWRTAMVRGEELYSISFHHNRRSAGLDYMSLVQQLARQMMKNAGLEESEVSR